MRRKPSRVNAPARRDAVGRTTPGVVLPTALSAILTGGSVLALTLSGSLVIGGTPVPRTSALPPLHRPGTVTAIPPRRLPLPVTPPAPTPRPPEPPAQPEPEPQAQPQPQPAPPVQAQVRDRRVLAVRPGAMTAAVAGPRPAGEGGTRIGADESRSKGKTVQRPRSDGRTTGTGRKDGPGAEESDGSGHGGRHRHRHRRFGYRDRWWFGYRFGYRDRHRRFGYRDRHRRFGYRDRHRRFGYRERWWSRYRFG